MIAEGMRATADVKSLVKATEDVDIGKALTSKNQWRRQPRRKISRDVWQDR